MASYTLDGELGYIAGFLDADGSVSMIKAKSKRYSGKRGGIPYIYRPVIVFTNTDKDVLEWLQRNIPFNMKLVKRNNKRRVSKGWSTAYNLTMTNKSNIASLLRILLPFLKIKKERASFMIDFCDSRSKKHGLSTEARLYTSKEIKLAERIRKLNKVGGCVRG